MGKLLGFFIIAFFCSCNEVKKPESQKSIKEIDSLLEIQKANYIPEKEVFKDTIGVSASPIKVLSARLIKEEYTSGRSLSITCKNVSEKNIEGIRFHWMTDGPWGKEDMGRYASLRTSELIKKGHTDTYTWEVQSNNKKVYLVWPHEVVFSDGTKWQLPSH